MWWRMRSCNLGNGDEGAAGLGKGERAQAFIDESYEYIHTWLYGLTICVGWYCTISYDLIKFS